MNRTAYVVMEIGYDYDDNYYHPVGRAPKQIFLDKIMAEIMAKDLNLKEFKKVIKENELGNYMGAGIENAGDDELSDVLIKFGFSVDDNYLNRHTNPRSISDEAVEEIFNHCSLKFYKVIEVEANMDYFYSKHVGKKKR